MLQNIFISNKCCTFYSSKNPEKAPIITDINMLIITEQHIILISEDHVTEDRSNDAENTALITEITY